MQNFSISFSASPWWLLLLIPAVVLTLIPYFRLSKRYRRTRNRIGSIILHLTVMTLIIATVVGMTFHYEIPNDENEIIVLVDMSDTEEQSQEQRDAFVDQVLEYSQFDNYKVGVVTFGFDQRYAVPLTYEVNEIYDAYLAAELPDTSATNLADALEYTRKLFNNPQTAKIVLVTDGKETDGNAASNAIRAVAAQGTKLDVAYVPSAYEGNDVQIVGVELPDYHVNVNEECKIKVLLQSRTSTMVTVELTDEGEANSDVISQSFDIVEGNQTLSFGYTFKWEGLHELRFKITTKGDLLQENNVYSTYLYLEVYNNILILESVDDSSLKLAEMLNNDLALPYNITIKNIQAEDLPKTTNELRLYDQVILNNIANSDMPDGFMEELEAYVNQYGGGLFTVGGKDANGNAHAYNRADMAGTLYQQMLPVQAINYTPPVGVMLIIDRSGSMDSADNYGDIKLEAAKSGAASCLRALTERDYVGIMTLDDTQAMILPMTSRTKESEILAAINTIDSSSGGTVFSNAVDRAGSELRLLKQVDKRHIMIVTDGAISSEDLEEFRAEVESLYQTDGITVSIVAIGLSATDKVTMEEVLTPNGGKVYAVSNTNELVRLMREDLNAPEITEVVPEEFNPIVNDLTSPLVQGIERLEGIQNVNKLSVTLDGFFGVKARASQYVVLMGDYEVPIYAQWKYGNGTVGSFMCDLTGDWSAEFMENANGQAFIRNVVNNLMPTQSIRPTLMNYELVEDNYTNQLSVYTTLEQGEYIKGEIIGQEDGEEIVTSMNTVTPGDAATLRELSCYVTTALDSSNNYSRCNFVIKGNGTYKIVLTKYDALGKIVQVDSKDVTVEIYKSFSYSEEYDSFTEANDAAVKSNLESLAERTKGVMIADLEDPWEVVDGFVTAIPKIFDPRFLFVILAIVLMLADIAIRKFKFKWPHELIREYKEKKNLK